jgi:ubiquinone/menaquinone biosynthesis C-methylase UbiE
MSETRAVGEDLLVRKLNEIFYDVEAAQYDERHPEVIEGDVEWWRERGAAVLDALRTAGGGAALRILDVGCGTGFVSGALAGLLDPGDLLVGVDQSRGMLARARAKTAGAAGCAFVRGDAAALQFADRSFDLVTVNSFLHHVFDYRAVLREIDRVLRPGGYLMLAHEPNRDFFRSPVVRLAGSAWKLMGLGMRLPPELCAEINQRLRAAALAPSGVEPDRILRLVEYHSPVEQGAVRIDPGKGFRPADLLARELAGYGVVELTAYSTFYHRPLLQRHPWLMRVAKRAASVLKGKGNLFSAVLRKGTA